MRSSSKIGYKFYTMRASAGALLSLPLLLLSLWYAWSAFAQVDRYQRGTDDAMEWSAELFQIALHDELTRDYKRMNQAGRPAASRLPTFDLSLDRENLDALNQQLYSYSERNYVNAYI